MSDAPDWIDDIDTVGASLRYARAITEAVEIMAGDPDPKHDLVGTGLLADLCGAADELLKHGQAAFKRMESRRQAAARATRS